MGPAPPAGCSAGGDRQIVYVPVYHQLEKKGLHLGTPPVSGVENIPIFLMIN
jgi:hypothetical protein